jgi:uncharacterized protein
MIADFLARHSTAALSFLVVAAFIASLARGFSGFGGALIFVPLASAAVGPQAAAPILLVIDGFAQLALLRNAWREANRREVGIMAAGPWSAFRSAPPFSTSWIRSCCAGELQRWSSPCWPC